VPVARRFAVRPDYRPLSLSILQPPSGLRAGCMGSVSLMAMVRERIEVWDTHVCLGTTTYHVTVLTSRVEGRAADFWTVASGVNVSTPEGLRVSRSAQRRSERVSESERMYR
jgi:hypothetical protein